MFYYVYLISAWVLILLVKVQKRFPNLRGIRFTKAIILNHLKDKFTLTKLLLPFTKPCPVPGKGLAEIHSVICHKDMTQYIVCLKSFLYFSLLRIPVVVHDDGSLTKADVLLLRKHFPGVRVILYSAATGYIAKALTGFDHLKRERLFQPQHKFHLVAMLDVPFFSKAEKIIYLDSDILFYNKPNELIDWVVNNDNNNETFYMQDVESAYSLSEEILNKFYKPKVIPNFNSGLRCFWKRSANLSEMDKMLRLLDVQNRFVLYRDQTYALLDSMLHYKKAGSLPATYAISSKDISGQHAVCIHYITPERWRLWVDAPLLLLNRMYNLF